MTMSDVIKHKYLIIGGTGKAGTTSVFNYLSSHPQICAAILKEPGFFLDRDYPIDRICQFEEGLDKYEKIFTHCPPGSIRLEATPFYLYSEGTPLRIKRSIPDVKLLFILREPISFLFSTYRYGKQLGNIPVKTTFEQYVSNQFKKLEGRTNAYNTLSLSMGRYSTFLKPYFSMFGKERIMVAFYEDLIKNTNEFIQRICTFVKIDPAFYEDYHFARYNPTVALRSQILNRIYKNLHNSLHFFTYDKPRILNFLKKVKMRFEPIWFMLNRSHSNKIDSIDEVSRDRLMKYYREENADLELLLKEPVPWG